MMSTNNLPNTQQKSGSSVVHYGETGNSSSGCASPELCKRDTQDSPRNSQKLLKSCEIGWVTTLSHKNKLVKQDSFLEEDNEEETAPCANVSQKSSSSNMCQSEEFSCDGNSSPLLTLKFQSEEVEKANFRIKPLDFNSKFDNSPSHQMTCATKSVKPAVKASEFKNLLRSFKKFLIQDFNKFLKATAGEKGVQDDIFWTRLEKYISARGFEQERSGTLHYCLGLIINPRQILSWKHKSDDSDTTQTERNPSQGEITMCPSPPILIQDLLLHFSLQKMKEFFNVEENKRIFSYFLAANVESNSKFKSELKAINC